MASVAGLTLAEPILPLKQTFNPDDLRTTKIEHTWSETVNREQRDRSAKMYLPVCGDPSNKELFLYVVDQFIDACHDSRLHLTTGDSRYNKFRQVLDGSLRIEWQNLSDARTSKTVDTFKQDYHALINKHLAPSSRLDQMAYLMKTTKIYGQEPDEVSARLTVINRLGRLLPGSWDTTNHEERNLMADDQEMKRALFNIMPMPFRIAFARTAHRIDDADFTYANLTAFFQLQHAIEKSARGQKRPRHQGGRGFGRGRGRGRGGNYGRGFGRGYGQGNGGRGFGYGNYHNYGIQRSNNPYVVGAQGGRIPGRGYPSPQPGSGRAGYQSPRGGAPRVSNSPSPRRVMPRRPGGRGPPPNFPQFMAEDHYYQGDSAQDYQEHYYEDPFYEEQLMQEQFGGGEQYYQGNDTGETYYDESQADEHYYQGEEQKEEAQNGDDQPEDAHFLADFGY